MKNVIKVNRRVLATFLAVVFTLSCFLGVNFALRAKGDTWNPKDMKGEVKDIKGLVINKGLRQNGDTYEVRLEAKATGSAVNQPLEENSPLDVVVVKDAGAKMPKAKDVKAEHYPVNGPFTVAETAGKYVKVGDEYKEVLYEVDTDDTYLEVDTKNDLSTAASPWTASSVYDWTNSSENNGRKLFYKNGNDYVEVTPAPEKTFSSAGKTIAPASDSNIVKSTTAGTNYRDSNYYVYVKHNASESGETSGWHKVYYKATTTSDNDGWTGTKYTVKYTFYYYKDSEEKATSDGNPKISSNTDIDSKIKLLNSFEGCTIIKSTKAIGGYDWKSEKSFAYSTDNAKGH